MSSLKKRLAVATCVSILAAAAWVGTVFGAHAQPAAVGPTKPVLIVNPPSEPVPVEGSLGVTDLDNPAFQPFQHAALAIIQPGFSGGSATFTVPAGKRLVIEYVSFNIPLTNGQSVLGVSVEVENSNANQIPIGHEIPVLYTVADSTLLRSIGASATRLYADPGSTVRIRAARSGSTGQDIAPVNVSGYFVDLP
jgi:hypothetical protein